MATVRCTECGAEFTVNRVARNRAVVMTKGGWLIENGQLAEDAPEGLRHACDGPG